MGKAAGGGSVHDIPAPSLADSLPNLCCVQELQRRDQSLHLRAAVVSNQNRRLEQLSSAQVSAPFSRCRGDFGSAEKVWCSNQFHPSPLL